MEIAVILAAGLQDWIDFGVSIALGRFAWLYRLSSGAWTMAGG